jgi:hypothetical protein
VTTEPTPEQAAYMYEQAGAALAQLRDIALVSYRNGDNQLGQAIAHYGQHHPQETLLVFTLAMVDYIILSEACSALAKRLAAHTGGDMEAILAAAMPIPIPGWKPA